MRRSPFRGGTIEIRRVFEAEDSGDAIPAGVAESEGRIMPGSAVGGGGATRPGGEPVGGLSDPRITVPGRGRAP